jgi:DnaJ family protein C protein 2
MNDPDLQYVYYRDFSYSIHAALFQISKLKEQLVLEDEKAAKAVQERKISKETGGDTSSSSLWSEDEHELLIKAVKLFPAGTNSR